MAEYYFNCRIKESGRESAFRAESRGLYVESSMPMALNAKKVLLADNIMRNICNINNTGDILHESKQIDEKIMREADFVYGITASHEKILKEDYPQYTEKIFAMP